MKFMRKHLETIVVAMITAALTAGAPAIAHVTSNWLHLRDKHIKPFTDGRYPTKTSLKKPDGAINQAGDPVHWTRLLGIPAALADGTDADGAPALAQSLGTDDGTVNESGDPVEWSRIRGVPSGFADGADDMTPMAILQVGTSPLTTYPVSGERYIVEAPPSSVGSVVPLDVPLVNSLCRDKDGCYVTVQMVNWNGDGNVATRSERFFISQTSGAWRFANTDIEGIDGTGFHELLIFDCLFGDAERRPMGSPPNGREDAGSGFGLLNVFGGSYSDSTTTCRVVLDD
jgi:hypothetical protein